MHAGCVGGDQELADAVVGAGDHEQQAGLRAGLDAVLDAVDAVTGVRRRRGDRRLVRGPTLPGLVNRPRRDRLAGDQRLDCLRMCLRLGRFHQRCKHNADRIQRARSHGLAELFGDHREVGEPVTGDAASAELLGNEQCRPAQFRGSLPPSRIERRSLRVQVPHPTQRNLFLQKCLGGGGEEYLFGGIDGSHDVGWDLPRPTWTVLPLRMKAGRASQSVVAGDPMVAMSNTVRDTGVQSIMTLRSRARHG